MVWYGRLRWSEEENEALRRNYSKIPYSRLSKKLGRSVAAIKHQVCRLGLSRGFGHPQWNETKAKLQRTIKQLWKDPSYRQKTIAAIKNGYPNPLKHYELILEAKKEMEEQGFRCIPIGKIVPDLIAIKGDNLKIFAVEVESGKGVPNYNKYDNVSFFDDIIWKVVRKNGT